MRNYLFHVYFKVDNDILWETASKSRPELVTLLESNLPPDQLDIPDEDDADS